MINLDIERCRLFLINKEIPMAHRSRLLNRIRLEEKKIKTFKDLEFKRHPNAHIFGSHVKEAVLFFINGYGISVVSGIGSEYKYHVLRINRSGGEVVKENSVASMQYHDLLCNTEEEVTAIMKIMQDKPIPQNTVTKIISCWNFLQTYKKKKLIKTIA